VPVSCATVTSDRDATVPTHSKGRPVRAIALTVTAGPDCGKSLVANDDPVTVGTADRNHLQLEDRTVSRYHLELCRRADRIRVADLGSTNGTTVGPVLLEHASALVAPGAQLALGSTRLRVDDGDVRLCPPLPSRDGIAGLRGRSHAMQVLISQVEEIAGTNVSVVLLGESGVGKEMVARALHALGPRCEGPLVVVDCGAVPASLFASELFGHERGAFTGADRRHAGAFERAHGGTLFLDEVGELQLDHQVALLGALERKRVRRVGGTEDITVDVRVIAATHRDLRAAVNAGRFRLDLYYRLAVVFLEIPPLRERPEDVPILIDHFLREAGHDEPLEHFFPSDVLEKLTAHEWPGNVRELRNIVAATVALGTMPALEATLATSSDPIGSLLDKDYREARGILLSEFERRYLTRLLERSGRNFREAARIGRMDRSHLLDLLRRHGFR
jgi:DNA-binding NtrC family response regulator